MTTTQIVDIILAALAARNIERLRSTTARHQAEAAVAAVLRPYAGDVRYWLISPSVRESVRAYARRAVRYLVARRAEAGLSETIHDPDACAIGMQGAHLGVSGPEAVSHLELATGSTK